MLDHHVPEHLPESLNPPGQRQLGAQTPGRGGHGSGTPDGPSGALRGRESAKVGPQQTLQCQVSGA
eukprot:9136058-Alexandrium_andersonii.AAC.1